MKKFYLPKWQPWFLLPIVGGVLILFNYLGLFSNVGEKSRLIGNASWKEVTPSVSPPARRSAAIAYNSDDGVTVLFGGVAGEEYFNDTWVYQAKTNEWKEVKPPVAPSPRAASLMVYDGKNNKFILFGGFVFLHSVAYKDTWAYDYQTNTWTEMKPAVSPNLRASYALAYNEVDGYTLLFGGFQEAEGTFWYNDMWKYDVKANTWDEIKTTNTPIGRGAPGFVYDSANKVFVLFGGFHEREYFNDTWTFDPQKNEWKNRNPATAPPHRRTRLAFDAATKRVILFGGESPIGGGSTNKEENPFHLALNDDTWIYDAKRNAWQKIETDVKPPRRGLHSIVHDRLNNVTILFGGTDGGEHGRLGDTWLLRLGTQ